MNNPKDLDESVIFPKGEKVANAYFTGAVWLKTLASNDDTFDFSISNVTFGPGARNNWHKHPGGQILLVTGGQGYYQEQGKPAQKIMAGDVIKILPGVKHWHGAGPRSWLVHLALSVSTQQGVVDWLEPVNTLEYNNLK